MPETLERKEVSKEEKLEILELNMSKILITNCRTEPTSCRKKLEQHLESFKNTNFFHQTQWPLSDDATNSSRISPLFDKHPYETYLYSNPLTTKMGSTLPEPKTANSALHTYYTMTTDSLKRVCFLFFSFLFELRVSFSFFSQQNMIFGILMSKVFILILHLHHHRNRFDLLNKI